jgi:hypothetical protein
VRLRPQVTDYNAYYETYIKLVPEGDLLDILAQQHQMVLARLSSISVEKGDYRYAHGKWTVKEVLGHMADNERIMAYRLLCLARGDKTPLPGYDQDVYVPGASFHRMTLDYFRAELSLVRQSTLSLFSGISEEAWQQQGTVSGGPITPLALACIIAGHELHHYRVLEERYF